MVNPNKKSLFELPEDILLMKHHLFDSFFTRKESNYYFSMIYNLEIEPSPKIKKLLFKKGALIKVSTEKNEKPTFYPNPPTFIYFAEKNFLFSEISKYKEAIENMEKVYLENFHNLPNSIFQEKQIFFIGKDIYFIGLFIFIIKYFLKKKGYITPKILDQNSLNAIKFVLEDTFYKIKFMVNSEYRDKLNHEPNLFFVNKYDIHNVRQIIIDDRFMFEVLSTRDSRGERLLTGYMTGNKDAILETEKMLEYKLQRVSKVLG